MEGINAYGRRRMIGLAVGLLVAPAYFVLAFAAFGGGHGTFLPFILTMPFPLGLIVFPVTGFLAADLRTKWSRTTFLFTLAAHFALLAYGIFRLKNPVEQFWLMFEEPSSMALAGTGLYLGWQTLIWAAFFLRSRVDVSAERPQTA